MSLPERGGGAWTEQRGTVRGNSTREPFSSYKKREMPRSSVTGLKDF